MTKVGALGNAAHEFSTETCHESIDAEVSGGYDSSKRSPIKSLMESGMGWSTLRGVVSGVLAILFPFSMLAADSTAAMLYTSGAAWVNGANVPHYSSAIFSGDLLQTRSDSVASINQPGSTITVLSDSLVKFELTSLQVEHGGVTVSTSKRMATTAGEIKVAPVSNVWTEFNVTDVDGTVRIAARKGDVTVSDGQDTVNLSQGQETTRDESSSTGKDGKKKNQKNQKPGAVPAAHGGTLNSPVAVGVGAAAVGALATWVLIKNDEPVSPDRPR